MTEPEEKKGKKLIFRGSYAYWADEYKDRQPATSLGWEFAMAALRGEPVHLLDGFLFHDTWRLGKQDGDYLDLFRTNKSKANKILKNLGIENTKIERRDKADRYSFQLSFPPDGLACNITEAVRLAHQAREEFRKGNPAGCDLIREAYREYPDPRSICQALLFAGVLPDDPDAFDKCLNDISERLQRYTVTLIDALYRVLVLAGSETPHGITNEIAKLATDWWIEELSQLKEVGLLLDRDKVLVSAPSNLKITEFITIFKKYLNLEDHLSQLKQGHKGDRSSAFEGNVVIVEKEAAKILDQLIKCDAVEAVVKDIADYYEQLPYLGVGWKDVSNVLETAVHDFSEKIHDLPHDSEILYYQFWRHLRVFVGKYHKSQGIKDELESDKDKEEQRKQFRYILENMVDKKEARKEITRLFDITGELLRRQNKGAPIPTSIVSLEKDLYLLLTVEELLETEYPPPAQWFRPGGPVISDFKDERVHIRKVVQLLKEQVRNNTVFLLEGDAATGKTVIVRTLIHELYEDGRRDVYYFDVGSRRHFSDTQLMQEIKAVKGIFVIENIHLEPRTVQLICQKIKHYSDRHILFTARHREFQDEFELPILTEIKRHTIKPFEEVKGVIECFCSHGETRDSIRKIIHSKIDRILEVTKGDYWLLAFALQGCVDNDGKGDPASWIAHQVNKYLRNLESCKDRHADQYPRILVALSPLYTTEVLTDERYLIEKLGITKLALNDLAKRGEITRQKDATKNFLYGLPHCSRAKAYWEYSRGYMEKELQDDKEFVYHYATSDVPNGLEAVMAADEKTSRFVLRRLYAEGKLTSVLKRELSMWPVYMWADNEQNVLDIDPLNKKLWSVLATKIATHDDFEASGRCLCRLCEDEHAGRAMWQFLNLQLLGRRLSETNRPLAARACIGMIALGDIDLCLELVNSLEPPKIADNLNSELSATPSSIKKICDICKYIVAIGEIDPRASYKIWRRVHIQKLVDRLTQEDIECPKNSIDYFNSTLFEKTLESLIRNKKKELGVPEVDFTGIVKI